MKSVAGWLFYSIPVEHLAPNRIFFSPNVHFSLWRAIGRTLLDSANFVRSRCTKKCFCPFDKVLLGPKNFLVLRAIYSISICTGPRSFQSGGVGGHLKPCFTLPRSDIIGGDRGPPQSARARAPLVMSSCQLQLPLQWQNWRDSPVANTRVKRSDVDCREPHDCEIRSCLFLVVDL
jgi:hypothetical protein